MENGRAHACPLPSQPAPFLNFISFNFCYHLFLLRLGYISCAQGATNRALLCKDSPGVMFLDKDSLSCFCHLRAASILLTKPCSFKDLRIRFDIDKISKT